MTGYYNSKAALGRTEARHMNKHNGGRVLELGLVFAIGALVGVIYQGSKVPTYELGAVTTSGDVVALNNNLSKDSCMRQSDWRKGYIVLYCEPEE